MRQRVVVALSIVIGAVAVPPVLTAQALSPALRGQVQDWYRRVSARSAPGEWGIAIGTMDGDILWSASAETPMIPASTAKVFTTGFARMRVGGQATKSTRIVGSGQLDGAGTWRGSWTLEVSGDPTLERAGRSGPTLRRLAEALAERGVRRLDGPLVVTSRLGTAASHYPAVWSDRYQGKLYAPPVGPVTLHENTVSFTVRPGRANGQAPTIVSAYPAGAGTLIQMGAVTVPGSRTRLSLTPTAEGGWHLTGTIGVSARLAGISAVAHDPNAVLARSWAAALEQAGIRWEPRGPMLRPVPGPGRLVLAEVRSAPFDTLASEVNRRSLNIGAEALLQWGAGNQTDGPAAVTAHVREVVGPVAQVQLVDGSGLSDYNRMSPMTQVLYLARYPHLPGSSQFARLLPANGTGTLRRLRQGMGPGVVHAKTGTLDNVATLTGYLGRPDGVLVISLMYNGRRTHAARAAQWELFRILGADGVNVGDALDIRMGGTTTAADR
jgi:serine-type D-Ala-D-Ala carboxypeptidase/endopeptidase (penicillin-binding protein 4)